MMAAREWPVGITHRQSAAGVPIIRGGGGPFTIYLI